MKLKKFLGLLMAAALLVSSVACSQSGQTSGSSAQSSSAGSSSASGSSSSSQSGSGSGQQEELIPVTVSDFRGISWASTYLGYKLGFFEEEGLDVEFILYKDGPIAFQGMHAGDSDFCLLSIEPVMTAYDQGMESYVLLSNTNNRTYAFASTPDIQSVADLKGKTIFAGMPGSAPYSFVLSMLASAGLSENDVTFINLDYASAIIALGEGQVDGIFFDIYNLPAVEEALPDANVLVNCGDPETHKAMFGSEYCQTQIVTCTKKFADENPEVVQKFVNASVKTFEWIQNHTSAEMAKEMISMFDGMTEEDLAQKLETIKSSFSPTGEITEEGYATVQSFCLEQGLITKEIPYEDFVASQFMDKALGK